MNLYRLIMLPNGSRYHEQWIETDDLPRDACEPFNELFTGLKCEGSLPTDHGDFRVLWNGGGNGTSLGTYWLAEQMFLVTVFAPNIDPAADEQMLTQVGQQWAGTDLVKAFAGGQPSPFETLAKLPERPLLVGMLIPVLEAEAYRDIAGVDLLVATAFLDKLKNDAG
jgi:hypothetical protein